jgi:hypothetical protein
LLSTQQKKNLTVFKTEDVRHQDFALDWDIVLLNLIDERWNKAGVKESQETAVSQEDAGNCRLMRRERWSID